MKTKCYLIFLLLLPVACSKKVVNHAADITNQNVSYMLPSKRPSDDLRDYLLEALQSQPENAVYHRDLGALLQSRTPLIQPPERWEIVAKAHGHLAKADKLQDKDPMTLMFLGLSMAASAKGPKVGLFSKLGVARKGFDKMDEAVSLEPNNLSLRILRATAEVSAPGLLNRDPYLVEDYQFIKREVTAATTPPHLKALGQILLGDYYAKKINNPEKAKEQWQKALDQNTNFNSDAQSRLDGTYVGF